MDDEIENLNRAYEMQADASYFVEEKRGEVIHAITQLRTFKKMSLRSLAKEVHCSAMHLSDIEKGKRFPSDDLLEKIRYALADKK